MSRVEPRKEGGTCNSKERGGGGDLLGSAIKSKHGHLFVTCTLVCIEMSQASSVGVIDSFFPRH